MSGNLFDVTPQGGIQPQFVATPEAVFVNAAAGDFRLAAGSPAIGSGYQGGNLGASLPDVPDPPDPPDPPQTQPLILEYRVEEGGWQFGEELPERPRDICMRLRRGAARTWQVCGFAPGVEGR